MGGLPGSLDASFNPGLGANDEVRAIVVQPDGRILAGGRFKEFDGAAIAGLVRLSLDGRLEKTFVPQPQGTVLALALQPDGRVLLGGDFTTVGGEPRRRIARLLPDGTLDRSFDARGVLNREVRALALQPDGKILVGGSFDAAPAHKRLTRLNADGTRDPTFNPGAGASRIVWALALEPDGKILAGGDFTSFNGQTSGRLVRLLADGARDTSFDIGTGANNTVSAVYVQDDGKILVGGRFTTINGVPAGHVARLNPDGSLDSEFNAGTGVDGSVRSFAAQHSGKILIGGTFASVQGVPRNRVARLDANGAVDTSFDPGEGAVDGDLWRLALQTDRSLVIAGGFRSFNGVDCGRMARLNLGPAPGAR